MRKQMTAQMAGALRDGADKWNSIDWKKTRREVRRLQERIDANHYLPEYSGYYWRRRNVEGSKLLPAIVAA